MTGETSGDAIGAWYAKKLLNQFPEVKITAIGGTYLEKLGAQIYAPLAPFSIAGIVEILTHLPFIFRQLKSITNYICSHDFDTVILVDYPGFNLRLLKRLKQQKPSLHIIYVAPPQLWIWGSWRVKTLQNYCSRIVVMYPFEVAWYAARGVTVHWEGLPLLERLTPHTKPQEKKPMLAVLPGSRAQEIKSLLPIFVAVIKQLSIAIPEMTFGLMRAPSVESTTLQSELIKQQIPLERIKIIEPEQFCAIAATCFAALTKPGTCTLELALLGIPAIVAYKALALTYWLARCVTNIQYMSLPNLFLNQAVYQERLQNECNAKQLYEDILKLYHDFKEKEKYAERCLPLEKLKEQFSFTSSSIISE